MQRCVIKFVSNLRQVGVFAGYSNSNNSAPSIRYRYSRAWTLLVVKTRQLLSERENQSVMIICRVSTRRFFFLISGNVYKQEEMEIDIALSEIESNYDFTFK